MISNAIKKIGIAIVGAALALSLAACGGNASDGGDGKGTITLGFIPSWTDGRSVGNLLKVQLEEMGYTVEVQELSEPGPLYTALSQGDIDIYPSAWPEVTHASYLETYGDNIEASAPITTTPS
jgi:glycine betaine/proline transport system substrate-binding protein